jgi:hypothetical protein
VGRRDDLDRQLGRHLRVRGGITFDTSAETSAGGLRPCSSTAAGVLCRARLWIRHFRDVEELRHGLLAFKETYNQEWLIERLGFRSPTQVREAFAVRPAA